MKLGVKLIGGFVIVALIVVAVGYFGLSGAQRLGAGILQIGTNRLPSATSIAIILEAQRDVDSAENGLLAKGISDEDVKILHGRFDIAKKHADDARKIYEPLSQTEQEAIVWKQFVPAWDAWWKDHTDFVSMELAYEQLPTDEQYSKLVAWAIGNEGASFDKANNYLTQLLQIQTDAGNAEVRNGEATISSVRTISIIGLIVGPLLALFLGIVISTGVLRQLGTEPAMMMEIARRVSEGDLAIDLDSENGKKAVGAFASMKVMVVKLNEVLHGVQDAAAQVASSSEEISSSAQQLATGAQGQAATLEQTSASIEQLTASVEQVSEHAQNQAASVEQSSSSMTQMKGTVEQVSKTLGEVSTSSQESIQKAQAGAEAVVKAVGAIKAISASSEKIAGIINVISDIADQTNLLALNASIEAARAGEHGRGFAVVADEVSKLADRSATNTKEIEGLIKESGKSVTAGVEIAQGALDAMEAIIDGAKKTNEMVSALAGDVDQQINGIKEVAKATDSISEMSQSISAATEEQSTNAKQVSKAVENVNELTQQAASAAEEMSAATEELSSLAQRLLKQVETFKLSEEGGAAGRELVHQSGQSA